MICIECATAARVNAERVALEQAGLGPVMEPVLHPDNCACPCQHKPVGAWKGDKR